MTLRELLRNLESNGISARAYHVEYAIRSGHASEPMKDVSCRKVYTARQLRELTQYFTTRLRGRKVAAANT